MLTYTPPDPRRPQKPMKTVASAADGLYLAVAGRVLA